LAAAHIHQCILVGVQVAVVAVTWAVVDRGLIIEVSKLITLWHCALFITRGCIQHKWMYFSRDFAILEMASLIFSEGLATVAHCGHL
jgi:hypothetical protein